MRLSPIETHRVSALKPFHSPDQVGLRRLQQKMIMVAHQHVSMHLPTRAPADLAQGPQKRRPIEIVAKDCFSPIASVEYVGRLRPQILLAPCVPFRGEPTKPPQKMSTSTDRPRFPDSKASSRAAYPGSMGFMRMFHFLPMSASLSKRGYSSSRSTAVARSRTWQSRTKKRSIF
jgi:hypothetical protein